jgi:hypothetical protein
VRADSQRCAPPQKQNHRAWAPHLGQRKEFATIQSLIREHVATIRWEREMAVALGIGLIVFSWLHAGNMIHF